ncbi:MAG: LLM class flavin-dependent oxidoreductase [Candidatus Dadabacteria bacterium]|nr:LLM class flavin-dependent oxidoreductase [Candidatus Dadabacteria bacterium]NIQ15895.1 LLM class flavin-dependent oxidoreductase [Candidatus Dadabacteria bacterium]
MKFGVGLFSMQTHKDLPGINHEKLYSNTLDNVKLAEDVGFYSAWLSEHHFLEDGYCSSPLTMAAAMAARTGRIRIGTGALILTLHNPVRIAEDAATVDLISKGRFDLGIAIGYRKEEFDGFNLEIKQRPSLMEEGIEILEKSWKDEPFSYKGKRFNFENIDVTPKPTQAQIPIYIGAFEEPAIRRAGRLGYPLLIGPGRTTSMIKDTLSWFNDEAVKNGHDPDNIEHILLRETYLDEDHNKAVEGGTEYIINMYKFYFTLGVKIVIRGQQVKSLDDPLFEYLAEDRFMIGTPEYCIDEINKYKEETGINYIASRMVFPQAPNEAISNCIQLFGEKVISRI